MNLRLTLILLVLTASTAAGDELLFRYEGHFVPDPEHGWLFRGCCPDGVSDSVKAGRLVIVWDSGGGPLSALYQYRIAEPPDEPPPPPFWLEWRFRSNQPWDRLRRFCDAEILVQYMQIFDTLLMFGDTVISLSGDDAVTGLPNNEFRTFRFESPDGREFCYWIDGRLFTENIGNSQNMGYSSFQLVGEGPCSVEAFPKINEWDYVRYGTLATGELITATEPERGFHDPESMAGVDRFAVMFDQPNYVYVDDVTVEVTGGEAPQVLWTRRRDQDGPESLEIILDRPLPSNETTRFIITDGETTNVVRYTLQWADTNGDGAVDLRDAAALQNCFGPVWHRHLGGGWHGSLTLRVKDLPVRSHKDGSEQGPTDKPFLSIDLDVDCRALDFSGDKVLGLDDAGLFVDAYLVGPE